MRLPARPSRGEEEQRRSRSVRQVQRDATPLGRQVTAVVLRVHPIDSDAAPIRQQQAVHQAKQRALSRTVVANQANTALP